MVKRWDQTTQLNKKYSVWLIWSQKVASCSKILSQNKNLSGEWSMECLSVHISFHSKVLRNWQKAISDEKWLSLVLRKDLNNQIRVENVQNFPGLGIKGISSAFFRFFVFDKGPVSMKIDSLLFDEKSIWKGPGINPLTTNPTKRSNLLKQFVGCCFSVFGHLVGLALKGLKSLIHIFPFHSFHQNIFKGNQK